MRRWLRRFRNKEFGKDAAGGSVVAGLVPATSLLVRHFPLRISVSAVQALPWIP